MAAINDFFIGRTSRCVGGIECDDNTSRKYGIIHRQSFGLGTYSEGAVISKDLESRLNISAVIKGYLLRMDFNSIYVSGNRH